VTRTFTLPASSARAHRAPSMPGGRSRDTLHTHRERNVRELTAGRGEAVDHAVTSVLEDAILTPWKGAPSVTPRSRHARPRRYGSLPGAAGARRWRSPRSRNQRTEYGGRAQSGQGAGSVAGTLSSTRRVRRIVVKRGLLGMR
jgi:hypothetical protein